MNDKFENQKEQLLSIKHEISLLNQQVNFLLRNEKELGLLDLDVLMNRTHTIYDMLCAINLGDNGEEDDLDLDPESFTGLFGTSLKETSEVETKVVETPIEDMPQIEEETPILEETPIAETVPTIEEASIVEEEIIEETPLVDEISETTENQAVEEQKPEPVPTPVGDEYGFFFRFEDTPEEEKQEKIQEESVTDEQVAEPVIVDDKLVHFVKEIPEDQIPERDYVEAEDLVKDNPYEMPQMDEPDFELSVHETLGEKMIQDDHSLAAKLQQNPILDLKSVIGINDKFLFVNELFGGSMEKYNKSIENLNDLKTLNGAMIYLNELKIELQWNSSNEAYKKLSDLVRRKFE